MYRLSFTCSLLAMVNLSVTAAHLHVYQWPRFYGVRTGQKVQIVCYVFDHDQSLLQVEWHKAEKYPAKHKSKLPGDVALGNNILTIQKVKIEDSGIYFCKINQTWGLGTELQVFRHVDQKAVESRSKMKDFVIFVQAFLLILCITLPLIKYNKLGTKEDPVYDEPEIDHTYEGLNIEQCTADLYEDISTYAQCQEPEAAVESPKQE